MPPDFSARSLAVEPFLAMEVVERAMALEREGRPVPVMKRAFYVLADARRFGADSRALAFDLLERTGVGTSPGNDCGALG